MIKQELKVYCCEHCNFVSRFAVAAIRHEKFCKRIGIQNLYAIIATILQRLIEIVFIRKNLDKLD